MNEGNPGCNGRERSGRIQKNGDLGVRKSVTLRNRYIHTQRASNESHLPQFL